jgi:uncharacterized protein YlxP (DUF503 family)
MRPPPEILRTKKAIAYRIVESLEKIFEVDRARTWDRDKAARITESLMPLSAAEAEAEMQENERYVNDRRTRRNKPPKRSLMRELRAALNTDADLGTVISTAIDFITKHKSHPHASPEDPQ